MIRFAAKVSQPIGDFFLVSLPARELEKLCFTRPYERYRQDSSGSVENSSWFQRVFDKRRANPIAEFLKTQDATLPGTIVLAANYSEDGKFIDDDDDVFESKKCWKVRRCPNVDGHQDYLYELNIPCNPTKSAMVVDGQHRIGGFKDQSDEVLSMEVPCAIFLDLPIPLQAYVFATINFNQKPVNKSLNYELFAFDIDNEKPSTWSPDKLAVYLSRRLNADEKSPLRGHIKIGALDCTEEAKGRNNTWKISTATIVAGIMLLITKNLQNDRNRMNQAPISNRDRTLLIGLNCDDDKLPLRTLYISNDDNLIYIIILNYFIAVEALFNSNDTSFEVFHKTAGVTALFKVFQILLIDIFNSDAIDVSSIMWMERFSSQNKIVDFNDAWLLGSSGSHVGRIRDMLLLMTGNKGINDFEGKNGYDEYERLWKSAKVTPHA